MTTVLRPPVRLLASPRVVSYQSFYDSNDPADQPSAVIADKAALGGLVATAETAIIAPLLLAGYTINIPDTEGPNANLASMREYGIHTLNSLRAITNDPQTGVTTSTPVGMMGYSGGAIATEWASELAPTYAPDVARRLVGAAAGGVLVHPAHNLRYISGSLIWSGVMPAAFVGIGKAYGIDFTPYLSDFGRKAVARLDNRSIMFGLGQYPFVTWQKMFKPEYADPETVKPYVDAANQLIMGTGGTPTVPMFLATANGGLTEGTLNHRELGAGDGVMVAGDLRTLARDYCDRGVTVKYTEYPGLSHFGAMVPWLPQAYTYLLDRFAGKPAPSSCGSIKPGNPLDPLVHKAP